MLCFGYIFVWENAEHIGKELEYADKSADIYIDVTPDFIGEDFPLLCKKASATVTEVSTANIYNVPVTLKDNQKLYAVWSTPTEYYIVEDNIVVGIIIYDGSFQRDMSMKQYFLSDDCYNVKPGIAWDGAYGYFCWKTNNSYLILGAIGDAAYADQYYNWSTTTFILLKDLNQFKFISQLE